MQSTAATAATAATKTQMESVIVKVRKLLRLADENKNSSENERNEAMEAAMKLMQEHNLSHTAMTTKLHDEESVSNVTQEKSNLRNERWISCLASAVSQLYYTAIYTTWKTDEKTFVHRNVIAFVGTPANIAASISLTEWLLNSIRKESNRQFADEHTRKSFRLGAVRRLQERAAQFLREEQLRHDEQKKAQERAMFDHLGNCLGSEDDGYDNEGQPIPAPQNQLMVLRTKLQDDNNKFLDTLSLSRGRASRSISVSGNAYEAGKSYASGISLNKQIGGNNTKRIGG